MAVVVVRWGVADTHADIAFEEMSSWPKSGVTESGWLLASEEMGKALELDSSHPTYLQRMSRLLTIRMAMRPDEVEALGMRGLVYIEQSINVRPKWPLSWANLALLKYRLGIHDDRFNEAIVNATIFGPWEPSVHSQIAGIGAGAWAQMHETTQNAVMDNIERGLLSPVHGSPLAVVNAINRNLQTLETGFLPKLGDVLAHSDWTKNGQAAEAALSVQYWRVFKTGQRQLLAIKLAEVLARAGNTGLVGGMDDKTVISNICPYLPRKPKFAEFCKNRG